MRQDFPAPIIPSGLVEWLESRFPAPRYRMEDSLNPTAALIRSAQHEVVQFIRDQAQIQDEKPEMM